MRLGTAMAAAAAMIGLDNLGATTVAMMPVGSSRVAKRLSKDEERRLRRKKNSRSKNRSPQANRRRMQKKSRVRNGQIRRAR